MHRYMHVRRNILKFKFSFTVTVKWKRTCELMCHQNEKNGRINVSSNIDFSAKGKRKILTL